MSMYYLLTAQKCQAMLIPCLTYEKYGNVSDRQAEKEDVCGRLHTLVPESKKLKYLHCFLLHENISRVEKTTAQLNLQKLQK